MGSREEWCADKLSKLLNEELRITTLNEIKDHLTSIPQEEASRTANVLQLPLVFDCLNDTNTEQVDLACEVLSLCMNNLNLGESTSRYGVSLERALTHPYPSVKLMALKEIERNITKNETLKELCHRESLLNNIIRCIGDEDLAVAKKASNIVNIAGKSDYGIKHLVKKDTIVTFEDVMAINEVVRLRAYEVIINISKENVESFNVFVRLGFLNQILEELDSNDVLLRMNILELITQLGLSPHGFNFLEDHNVLDKMFFLFDGNNDPISVQLCEPGILKFFGHMSYSRPIEVLSKYPKYFDRLFANLESGDLIIVGISLDTLGHIAETNEGKIALNSTGNKMQYAVKVITKLLPSLPTDVRIRGLNCLENIIQLKLYKTDISNITRKWYILLGDLPMEFILKYAKNPFSEIRLSGLGLLNAVSGHYWGHEDIKNTPGLIEFLLDRSIEHSKECKEIKYEIIKQLAKSEVFDQSTSSLLKEYVKEGPFYVRAITEVAIEGDD